jgi:hypothetical protein
VQSRSHPAGQHRQRESIGFPFLLNCAHSIVQPCAKVNTCQRPGLYLTKPPAELGTGIDFRAKSQYTIKGEGSPWRQGL